MKRIIIDFYSYRPRLQVYLSYTSDLVPNVGDEIRIESKFISLVDKQFFGEYAKDSDMTFIVKKRLFNLGRRENPWEKYDARLEIGFTEEKLKEVDKYLKTTPKKRGNKIKQQ